MAWLGARSRRTTSVPKWKLPQAWKDPGKGEQLDEQWWKRFDDSMLNALVQEALIANRDIAAAVARVDYAGRSLAWRVRNCSRF